VKASSFGTACVIVLLACEAGWSQKPEYDFYREFRNTLVPQFRSQDPSISPDGLATRYAAKLRNEGVAESEISRRLRLVRSDRTALENDYWNRFYLDEKSNFNREPNAFLVRTVQGKMPGTALDYAMGDGRNAIYLARLGWSVSGFDPAGAAVDLAQKRTGRAGSAPTGEELAHPAEPKRVRCARFLRSAPRNSGSHWRLQQYATVNTILARTDSI
jgi:Tellurite resistance protein TehB